MYKVYIESTPIGAYVPTLSLVGILECSLYTYFILVPPPRCIIKQLEVYHTLYSIIYSILSVLVPRQTQKVCRSIPNSLYYLQFIQLYILPLSNFLLILLPLC